MSFLDSSTSIEELIAIAYIPAEPLFFIIALITVCAMRNFSGKKWLIGYLTIMSVVKFCDFLIHILDILESTHFQNNIQQYLAFSSSMYLLDIVAFFIFMLGFLANIWSKNAFNLSVSTLLFSWQGRSKRSVFLLVNVIALSLMYSVLVSFNYYNQMNSASTTLANIVYYILVFLLVTITLWALIVATIKRAHDCNHSGWVALILLIPVIGHVALLAYLGIKRGSDGDNKYGRPFINKGSAHSDTDHLGITKSTNFVSS